ncbi:MAG: YlxR family protein [Dehalococcoidia bacterium]|nr:YlxR family protein [Dehalococcoidia bacterium]
MRPEASTNPVQPLRPRHVPQRTCVGCRKVLAKRALVRIVRTPGGPVVADPTSRQAGRGAYVHLVSACWQEGLKKGRLGRALHTTIAPADQAALEAFFEAAASRQPGQEPTGQSTPTSPERAP